MFVNTLYQFVCLYLALTNIRSEICLKFWSRRISNLIFPYIDNLILSIYSNQPNLCDCHNFDSWTWTTIISYYNALSEPPSCPITSVVFAMAFRICGPSFRLQSICSFLLLLLSGCYNRVWSGHKWVVFLNLFCFYYRISFICYILFGCFACISEQLNCTEMLVL